MTTNDLTTLHSDAAMICAALESGETGAAHAIAVAHMEYLDGLMTAASDDAITTRQIAYLSGLTGTPESEFADLTKHAARGYIADLIGFGETTINGRQYIRIAQDKPKRTTADKKRARGGKTVNTRNAIRA